MAFNRLDDDTQSRRPFLRTAAALTTMVGVAAFAMKGGNKLLAQSAPGIKKALTSMGDDLEGMTRKDFTADNIGKFVKKHFTDSSSTFKNLKSVIDDVPRPKLTTSGFLGGLVKELEFNATSHNMVNKIFDNKFADDFGQAAFKSSGLDEKFEDGFMSMIRDQVHNNSLIKAVGDNGEILLNEDTINKFMPEFNLDKNGESFFESVLGTMESYRDEARALFDEQHLGADGEYDIVKNVKAQFTGKNYQETYGTKDTQGLKDYFLKGDAVSVKDFLENEDKFEDLSIQVGDTTHSLKQVIKDKFAQDKDIQDVLLDARNLRKVGGDFVSYQTVNEIKDGAMSKLAGTLPGQIFKFTDRINSENQPVMSLLSKGQASLGLESGNRKLENNYVQVMNKLFKVGEDGSLGHMKEYDNASFTSSRHGSRARLLEKMYGANSSYEATNGFTKKFDLNTTTDANFIDDMVRKKGGLGKFARSQFGGQEYNIIDELKSFGSLDSAEDNLKFRERVLELNSVFRNITDSPSKNAIKSIHGTTTNEMSKDLLAAVMGDNREEVLEELYKRKASFANKDLTRLLNKGVNDRGNASSLLSIKETKVTAAKRVENFDKMLRTEVFKEVMIREAKDGNLDDIMKLINSSGMNTSDSKNSKNLAFWAVTQAEGLMFGSSKNEKNISTIKAANDRVLNLIYSAGGKNGSSSGFLQEYQSTFNGLKANYKDLTTKIVDREKNRIYNHAAELPETIAMKRGYSPGQYAMDMIKSINDSTKAKANTERFGKQFFAGAKNSQFVTESTINPYFFTQRLIEPFNKYGLGLSGENIGSVGAMWKAIGMKRILPAALIIGYGGYANDMIKNITGTSVTGAMANGIANADLGLRKIADITGIGTMLKNDRRINPLSQYWFGDTYQNAEERKDWYENGYSANRKGRWWSFGSAAEFRGGKISYFEPNFVKRANSDWRDIGIYGSTGAKWAHSWLPTPTHPLAPLRKVLDPYWLERKHKDDRPYMETAPLFTEGTPWGAVLNPTVGQVIKPIRQMHRNETRRGLIDPRTLIAERNERLKEKALNKDDENLFRIGQKGVSNLNYSSNALIDPGQYMQTIRVSNRGVQNLTDPGSGFAQSVPYAGDAFIDKTGELSGEYAATGVGFESGYQAASSGTAVGISAFSLGSDLVNAVKSINPFSQLRDMNAQIMQRASVQPTGGRMSDVTNLAHAPARGMASKINSREDFADLMNTSSRHQFVSDAVFSMKQLSGIYGFMGDTLGGHKGRKVRRENAGKMSDFKTAFWDANIGGLGGGVMEIARRFFPHEDHSWTNINPIRNTMPDWMPERFQTGDPYRKVSKGEMRLPGAGYEDIHKLRSDQFGRYGALDRMRILADVSPGSDEYKLWRDIATKTVSDGAGRKEIEDIKRRVAKQSRAHEFYDYTFLKTPTEKKGITVDSIKGNTVTTTEGEQYTLAGIDLKKGSDVSEFLHSGQSLNVEYLKKDRNNLGPIKAAFMHGNESINKDILESKMATETDPYKATAIDKLALTPGGMSRTKGKIMEAITHAPIPFVHSKLMRIETPMESYKNERLYGTPYSTWDHPIKGFIKPAFEKAFARGPVGQGLAIGGWAAAEWMWKNSSELAKSSGIAETSLNKAGSIAMNLLNPGAFAASMIASVPTGLLAEEGMLKQMLSTSVFGAGVEKGVGRTAMRAGGALMVAGFMATRTHNPINSTAIFAAGGYAAAKQLQHKSIGGGTGALLGAGVGLAVSLAKNNSYSKSKNMFGVYVPKDTQRRRDIEEYFDRLEYIKWKGLEKKAARRAHFLEGVDISKIMRANEYAIDHNQKRIDRLNKRLRRISASNLDTASKNAAASKITTQIDQLENAEQVMRGGKYTKAAIAYRQAAQSTLYGLRENATSQEILRAIPKADKDYFMEFIKETDKHKRKEILKYVSPYERRALQIAWGDKKVDNVQSNFNYFRNHFMPGTFWAGWRPQYDIEGSKIKTIKNEGMMLSDFGIYESQADEPSVAFAPSIGGKFDKSGGTGLIAKLTTSLSGMGLIGTKVAVSPTSANGIQVIANITNGAKITEWKIRNGLNKITGDRMFY